MEYEMAHFCGTSNEVQELVAVYPQIWWPAPWNEFKKCLRCPEGRNNFGVEEVTKTKLEVCPTCGTFLVPYWDTDRVMEDITSELAREGAVCFVVRAKFEGNASRIMGFTWGYPVEAAEMQAMAEANWAELCPGKIFYVDELGVLENHRGQGLGLRLTTVLTKAVQRQGYAWMVLRTNPKARAALALYQKLGYMIRYDVVDRVHRDRVFLMLDLRKGKERGEYA